MDAASGMPPQEARSTARKLWKVTAPVRGVVVAGAIAGLISAGIGSRVVMRIIAAMNDDRDGVMTDASATVGEFTAGGTLSLLMLGVAAGIVGGLLYLGLRRWLWVPGRWRGAAFGALTLVTIGQPVFDPANVDFQIFEPVVVVVGMFAALFLINGLILAPLADRIHPQPGYPPGKRVPLVVAGAIALAGAFGLVLLASTMATMIDDAGTCYSAAGGGEGCAITAQDLAP